MTLDTAFWSRICVRRSVLDTVLTFLGHVTCFLVKLEVFVLAQLVCFREMHRGVGNACLSYMPLRLVGLLRNPRTRCKAGKTGWLWLVWDHEALNVWHDPCTSFYWCNLLFWEWGFSSLYLRSQAFPLPFPVCRQHFSCIMHVIHGTPQTFWARCLSYAELHCNRCAWKTVSGGKSRYAQIQIATFDGSNRSNFSISSELGPGNSDPALFISPQRAILPIGNGGQLALNLGVSWCIIRDKYYYVLLSSFFLFILRISS